MKLPALDSQNAPRRLALIKTWLRTGALLELEARGGSMSPTIRNGDRITLRAISPAELKADDLVVFVREDRLVAHRVVKLLEDGRVITRGDSQPCADPPIAVDDVIGKVVAHSRGPAATGARNVRSLAKRAREHARGWGAIATRLTEESAPRPAPAYQPKNVSPAQTFAIQHLARELVDRAARELRAAGIPFLTIKGMASAAMLYEDPLDRPYTDVDILIRWRDVPHAWFALERAGWQLELVSSHLFEARHPDVPAILLDGQGHAGFPLTPRGGLNALLSDSETFVLRPHPDAESSVALPTAGRDAMPAILAMFVVRDVAVSGVAGTPARDLPRAIDRASSPDAMWRRARELGLHRALLAAIDAACPDRLPGPPEPLWLIAWREATRKSPAARTLGQRRLRLLAVALLAGGPVSLCTLFTEMAVTKALRSGAARVRMALKGGQQTGSAPVDSQFRAGLGASIRCR